MSEQELRKEINKTHETFMGMFEAMQERITTLEARVHFLENPRLKLEAEGRAAQAEMPEFPNQVHTHTRAGY